MVKVIDNIIPQRFQRSWKHFTRKQNAIRINVALKEEEYSQFSDGSSRAMRSHRLSKHAG